MLLNTQRNVAVSRGNNETITIPTIQGVTPPVAGRAPVSAITASGEFTGTVTWSPDHATFETNTVYTATITIASVLNIAGVPQDFFQVDGAATTNPRGSGVVTAAFPSTLSVATGDEIFVGFNKKNNNAPIPWLVVDADGLNGIVTLLSKDILEVAPFHHESAANMPWADTDVSRYLNGEFFDNTFNTEEKAAILAQFCPVTGTRVILPSEGDDAEMRHWGMIISGGATAGPVIANFNGVPTAWWMRDAGATTVRGINASGERTDLDHLSNQGYRPAIKVRLEALPTGLVMSTTGVYNFGTVEPGYSQPPEALSVAVMNRGVAGAARVFAAEAEGDDASSFTVTAPSTTALLAQNTASHFTVRPNAGLPVRQEPYRTTIRVTALPDDLTFEVVFTVSEISQFAIDIDTITPHNFVDATPLTVTVSNTGAHQVTGLRAMILGSGMDKFTVGNLQSTTIDVGGNTTFTVTPNALTQEAHATVIIFGNNGIFKHFDVRIAPTETNIIGVTVSSIHADGKVVIAAYNAAGMLVHFSTPQDLMLGTHTYRFSSVNIPAGSDVTAFVWEDMNGAAPLARSYGPFRI
jgi:hypothetical protein